MDAQEIILQLESTGISLKNIHELTGIGLSSLYAIKNGNRSGETSLPVLKRLLTSSQSYITLTAMPQKRIVESTLASNEKPTSQNLIVHSYTHEISNNERQIRGIEYRQSRNRYNVTPDILMEELQNLRYEIYQLRQEQLIQQKEKINKAKKDNNETFENYSLLNLLAIGINDFVFPLLEQAKNNQQFERKQIQQENTFYPVRIETPINKPVNIPVPSQHVHRRGIYGLPMSRYIEQEKSPSFIQKIKKFIVGK